MSAAVYNYSNGRHSSLKPGRLGTPFLVPAPPGFCASSSSLLPPPEAVAFGSVNSRGGCSLCRVVCSIWFKAKQKACRNDILFCLAPRVRLNRMTSTAVRLLVNSRSHVRGCILLLERTTLQLETMVVSALLFSCLRLPVSAHPQAPFSRHRRRSLSAQLTAGRLFAVQGRPLNLVQDKNKSMP